MGYRPRPRYIDPADGNTSRVFRTKPPPPKKRKRRPRDLTPAERREWEALREYLFQTRGRACERCDRTPGEYRRLEIHHRFPIFLGGPRIPEDPDDRRKGLAVLCNLCHRRLHSRPAERAYSDWLDATWGRL